MNVFKKLFSGGNKPEDDANSEYLNAAYNSLSDETNLNPDRIIDENSLIVSDADESDVSRGFDSRQDNSDGVFDVNLSGADNASDDFSDVYTDVQHSSFDVGKAYGVLGGDTGELDTGVIRAEAQRVDDYIASLEENEENSKTDDTLEMPLTEGGEKTDLYAQSDMVEDYDLSYGRDFNPDYDVDELSYAYEDEADENIADESEKPYEKCSGVSIDRSEPDEETEELLRILGAAGNVNSENSEDDTSEIDKELIYSAYAPKNMRPQITQKSYYNLEDIDKDDAEAEKPHGVFAFLKKRAKWIAGGAAAAVLVVGVIVACVFALSGGMDPLMGYSQTNAIKGNVIKTMAAGGNVEPNARYEITSLVNGTITESPLNAGEEVKAGELVYKVDDTNAQLAVQMAQNAVERAKVSGTSSSSDNLKIYANASGTITDLKISSGSTITGGQIATITQSNGTEIGLIPSVTGTVQSLNVREGSTVTSGQVIATLKSSGTSGSQEGQKLDIEGSELALEQAQKELEKYKIASPVDGTILVKNAKIGDNVTAGKTDKPLMVIADMSKMKFNIEVDELDIWNIQQGQTVVITANALPGETFSGEITNIAGEGEKKGSGVTTYAVEITISDPGKIKSGMNVDAKIIINSAINVLTLPENALYESDGKNALVITNSSSVDEDDIMNTEDYPHINVPDGYKLVKVQYGVSDGTNVEITSGLSVGDIVLYKENSTEPYTGVSNADSSSQSKLNSNSNSSNTGSESSNNKSSEDNDELSGTNNAGDSAESDIDSDSGDNVKSTGKSALQNNLDI